MGGVGEESLENCHYSCSWPRRGWPRREQEGRASGQPERHAELPRAEEERGTSGGGAQRRPPVRLDWRLRAVRREWRGHEGLTGVPAVCREQPCRPR